VADLQAAAQEEVDMIRCWRGGAAVKEGGVVIVVDVADFFEGGGEGREGCVRRRSTRRRCNHYLSTTCAGLTIAERVVIISPGVAVWHCDVGHFLFLFVLQLFGKFGQFWCVWKANSFEFDAVVGYEKTTESEPIHYQMWFCW
jgi:hypothetical protein